MTNVVEYRPAQSESFDAPPAPSKLAQRLGWFSIALGITEMIAPRVIKRLTGVDASPAVVRYYGVREVASGLGILCSRNAEPFLWARVGGDAIDLGTLGATSRSGDPKAQRRTLMSVINVLGITALDVYAAYEARRSSRQLLTQSDRLRDYATRSGFPRSPEQMRGVARTTSEVLRDVRTPGA